MRRGFCCWGFFCTVQRSEGASYFLFQARNIELFTLMKENLTTIADAVHYHVIDSAMAQLHRFL